MGVRAKFQVNKISKVSWNKDVKVVELGAVCADEIEENQRYHKYTPSGAINITIDNPLASDQFELGKLYYVDFTTAE